MSYLDTIRKVKKELAEQEPAPVAANRPAHLTADEIIDIDNGKISAVLMDSDFGPLWFAFSDDFKSGDDIPVFFASELASPSPDDAG